MMDLPFIDYSGDLYSNELARLFWGRLKHLEKAATLMRHQGGSTAAYPIYKLKYFGSAQSGVSLGILFARRYLDSGLFADIDVIVPVPISPKRKRQRGYNQSDCIADGISQVTGLPVCRHVVARTQFVKSQTGLSPEERQANVAHVFKLRDGRSVEGKHLLLVDDVVTTGATMLACARTLDNIPGVRISVASIGFAYPVI